MGFARAHGGRGRQQQHGGDKRDRLGGVFRQDIGSEAVESREPLRGGIDGQSAAITRRLGRGAPSPSRRLHRLDVLGDGSQWTRTKRTWPTLETLTWSWWLEDWGGERLASGGMTSKVWRAF